MKIVYVTRAIFRIIAVYTISHYIIIIYFMFAANTYITVDSAYDLYTYVCNDLLDVVVNTI